MDKKLLIDGKSPTVFQKEIAVVLGLSEAIILQQLNYWIENNRRKQQNYRDGYYWMFNTYEQLHQQLPFFSVSTIKRTISKLKKDGLVYIGNYNKKGYDSTNWYRIDTEKLHQLIESVYPNDTLEDINMTQPIPNNNHKIKKDYKEKKGYIPEIRNQTIVQFIDTYMNDYYKQRRGKKHPALKHEQWTGVYNRLLQYSREKLGLSDDNPECDLMVYETLCEMAGLYFNGFPKNKTDWNINHFSQFGILVNREYELMWKEA